MIVALSKSMRTSSSCRKGLTRGFGNLHRLEALLEPGFQTLQLGTAHAELGGGDIFFGLPEELLAIIVLAFVFLRDPLGLAIQLLCEE